MANKIPREQIGGEGIHVGDCYVWMEISYLDSPSDYREYLPKDRQSKPNDDLLVMLERYRGFTLESRTKRPKNGGIQGVWGRLPG